MPDLALWRRDLAPLAPAAGGAAVDMAGERLLSRWSEPHRHYHDRAHLAEMLTALDELSSVGALAGEDVAVARMAAWWHDAVYAGVSPDDERASAALAETELRALGVPAPTVRAVVALVAATATHETDGQALTGAFLDADLWILSAPTERFDTYCAQVRREHPRVDDTAYRLGRSAVLTALVERPHVYASGYARDAWEPRARVNVARELTRL